jgi:hypothetical protein
MGSKGYRGYRGYRVRKVGEVVVVHLRREKLLACITSAYKHERRGSPLQERVNPLLPIGTVGRAAAPQSSHNAVKGTDDPVNGTDNAVKGTDNAVKGSDNAVEGTDKATLVGYVAAATALRAQGSAQTRLHRLAIAKDGKGSAGRQTARL